MPSNPLFSSRDRDLFEAARDKDHPIGSLCMKTALRLIPEEWLSRPANQWPTRYSAEWGRELQRALHTSSRALKRYVKLSDTHLKALVAIGVDHVKQTVKDPTLPTKGRES